MRLWVESRRLIDVPRQRLIRALRKDMRDEMLKDALELGGEGIHVPRFHLYRSERAPGEVGAIILGLARVAGGPVEVPLVREEPSCAIPGTGLRITTQLRNVKLGLNLK